MSGVVNVQVDGKAAEAAVEKTSGALATVFGPAARELGLAWGERLAFYRLKQSLEIQEKTLKLREIYPTPPEMQRSIPGSEGVRALEAASLEEEPAVQELWANLIRNATDQRTNVTIEKSFVELLSSLSAAEAIFLKSLHEAQDIEHQRIADTRLAIDKYNDTIKRYTTKGLSLPDEIERPNIKEITIKAHENIEKIFLDGWRQFDVKLRDFSIRNLVRIGLVNPLAHNFSFRPHIHGMEITVSQGMGYTRSIEVITRRELDDIIKNLVSEISVAIAAPEFDVGVPPKEKATSVIGKFEDFPELNFSLSPLATRLIMACSPPATPSAPEK